MRRSRLSLIAALAAVLFAGMVLHMNSSLATAAATPAKPAKDTVYITKSGKKFHRSICRTLTRSKKIAISRQDAVKKGYTACKACNP